MKRILSVLTGILLLTGLAVADQTESISTSRGETLWVEINLDRGDQLSRGLEVDPKPTGSPPLFKKITSRKYLARIDTTDWRAGEYTSRIRIKSKKTGKEQYLIKVITVYPQPEEKLDSALKNQAGSRTLNLSARVQRGSPSPAQKAITENGGEIARAYQDLIDFNCSPDDLKKIITQPSIRFVQPVYDFGPIAPEEKGRPAAGAIGEVKDIGAELWWQAGHTGKGIKVAVFGGGAREAAIIKQAAPGAEVVLIETGSGSEASLLSAIDSIIKGRFDIVCSPGVLIDRGPFDGSSRISKKISDAKNKGVAWINYAGDFENKHWRGSRPGRLKFFGDGRSVLLYLTWKDWGTDTGGFAQGNLSGMDYKLKLYREGKLFREADASQTRYAEVNPEEKIFLKEGAYPIGWYEIEIEAKGKRASELELFCTHDLKGASGGRAIPTMADAAGVFTTDAVPIAAGAAALVKEAYHFTNPDDIQNYLKSHTLPVAGSAFGQLFLADSRITGSAVKLVGLYPSRVAQGFKGRVAVRGVNFKKDTSFDFGSGIKIEGRQFIGPNQIFLKVAAADNTAAGLRDVIVLEGESRIWTAGKALMVEGNFLPLTKIFPDRAEIGWAGEALIAFDPGVMQVSILEDSRDVLKLTYNGKVSLAKFDLGQGIKVAAVKPGLGAGSLLLSVKVNPEANLGPRDVNIIALSPDELLNYPAYRDESRLAFEPGRGIGKGADLFQVTAEPPKPVLRAINPSSVKQGYTGEIIISGDYLRADTILQAGGEIRLSATGVSIGEIRLPGTTRSTLVTRLKAGLAVAKDAPLGRSSFKIANQNAEGRAEVPLEVILASPVVELSFPNQAKKGWAGTITVRGENFQGKARMDLGEGVTIGKYSYLSENSFQAEITVSPAAKVGFRDILVTNPDGGNYTFPGGFEVQAYNPVLNYKFLRPNRAAQGWEGEVAIRGSYLQPGAKADFGEGIIVNQVKFKDSDEISAAIKVDYNALPGDRDIIVTNPDGGRDSLKGWFKVLERPIIEAAEPAERAQGWSGQIVITGKYFRRGAALDMGEGVVVSQAAVNDASEIAASINISPTAAAGRRNITVTNPDGGKYVFDGGLSIAERPVISSLIKIQAPKKWAGEIMLSGNNLNNNAVVNFGPGVKIVAYDYSKAPAAIRVDIEIAAFAAAGPRNVTVSNPDGGSFILAKGFQVNELPRVVSVSPRISAQGWAGELAVKGSYFQKGAMLNFGGGIRVSQVSFKAADELSVNVNIDPAASPGFREISAVNPDGGRGVLASGIRINPRPTISSVRRSSAVKGWRGKIEVVGSNLQENAVLDFGPGIKIVRYDYLDVPESIKVEIETGAKIEAGARDAAVLNPDGGSFTLRGGLRITERPILEGVEPAERPQGWSGDVTLRGKHLQAGAAVSFGNGVRVEKLKFVSDTEIVAGVKSDGGAIAGKRNIRLINPDEGKAALLGGFTITEKPVIESLELAERAQGWSGDIAISGDNFQKGIEADFGEGIIVNSTTFKNPAEIVANIKIAAEAAAGKRAVAVVNPDGGTDELSDGFMLNPRPKIESAAPGERAQGWSGNITVKGDHFRSWAAANFGQGVTVVSTTFKNSKQLTANVKIDPAAAPGGRSVTVTNTDGGVTVLENALRINPRPEIESAEPAARAQGWEGEAAVAGRYFQAGAALNFGGGIAVRKTFFNDAGTLTADIKIAPDALPGEREVTVVNSDEGKSSAKGKFTVAFKPIILSAAPAVLQQGWAGEISIKGNHFEEGAQVDLGTEIIINQAVVKNKGEITVSVKIDSNSPVGGREITLKNPSGGQAALKSGIKIIPRPPVVGSILPGERAQGWRGEMIIKGEHFEKGAAVDFGSGVTILKLSVSETEIVAGVKIAESAPIGARGVAVNNPDGGKISLPQGFSVSARPAVAQVVPAVRAQGWSGEIAVKGINFKSGAKVDFGEGIAVNKTAVQSGTEILASIKIAADALIGERVIAVVNPDEGKTSAGGKFAIVEKPVILSVSPPAKQQGWIGTVAVKGSNFEEGAEVDFGGGIIVSQITYRGEQELAVSVKIAENAPIGKREISLTNPSGGMASLKGGIEVTPLPPQISAVIPGAKAQGWSGEITVKGSHFEDGAAVNCGAGIEIEKIIFKAENELAARINIAENAPAGARDITVNNPDGGRAVLLKGFGVAMKPELLAVEPAARAQGWAGEVVVRGGNFQSGTVVDFGQNVKINQVSFKNPAELMVNLAVDRMALPGVRSVKVSNPDGGRAQIAGIFKVNEKPLIESISPPRRAQGWEGEVSVKGKFFQAGAALNFGPEIAVHKVVVKDPAELIAAVKIAREAAAGPRDILLANPDGGRSSLIGKFAVVHRPILLSITPAERAQGWSGDVIIRGNYMAEGAALDFGEGIEVNNVVHKNGGELSANLAIAPDAPLGKRDIRLANTDGGSGILPGAFTVKENPAIRTVKPDRLPGGWQGWVEVAGDKMMELSSLDFGPEIAVKDYSWANLPRSIRARVEVAPEAAAGAREVAVLNPDGGISSVKGTITVTEKPAISAVIPDQRAQGWSGKIILRGRHFQNGAAVNFGNGVEVGEVKINGGIEIIAEVNIVSGAPAGARAISVVNPDEGRSELAGGFKVSEKPIILSANPAVRAQGWQGEVAVKGNHFQPGAEVNFGKGVAVKGVAFVRPDELTAAVAISENASPEVKDITVANPDGGEGGAKFSVSEKPALISVKPNRAPQGWKGILEIVGSSLRENAKLDLGSGIRVLSYDYSKVPRAVGVQIEISPSAALGLKDAGAVNPDEGTGVLKDAFEITEKPTIQSIEPHQRAQGFRGKAVIRGANFQDGAEIDLGAGIAISRASFISPRQIDLEITVADGALPGERAISLANPDSGSDVLAGGFEISGRPVIERVEPAERGQGWRGPVSIKGKFFQNGAEVELGEGVEIQKASFVSAGEIAASIVIPAGTAVGPRQAEITNPDDGENVLSGALKINPKPSLQAIRPAQIPQGWKGKVEVRGRRLADKAALDLGKGIAVIAYDYSKAPEIISAMVNAAADAPLGPQDIVMINPDGGRGILSGKLSVFQNPTVISVSPSEKPRGWAGDVVVKGANFQRGVALNFGGGIVVNSVTYKNERELMVNLTISGKARKGARDIEAVNSDGGAGKLPRGFRVN